MSAKSLRNAYRGRSRFTVSGYIDPDGFEYGKSIISCADCVFIKEISVAAVFMKKMVWVRERLKRRKCMPSKIILASGF